MDFVPLGNPCPQEVIFKFRVHPSTVTSNSEDGLEGFVCLFNMEAKFFVWGWEKLLWQLCLEISYLSVT